MRIKDISFCGQTLYCYSLRIDIDFNGIPDPPAYFDARYIWIQNHFKYALVAREKSDLGKWHLQCFCAHTYKYDEKELLKMRHYIKAHLATKTTKQPVSLKRSWSPLGLFTYCQKDGDVERIMPNELFYHLEHLAEAYSRPPREQVLHKAASAAGSLKHLVRLLCDQVHLGALKSVPRKAELWRLAFRFSLIDFDTYYEEFYSPRK